MTVLSNATTKIADVPEIENPFPELPQGLGMKMNTSASRLAKYREMAGVFASGVRPSSFEETYSLCKCVCGQYLEEAKAIWDFVRGNNIKRIAEVGRNIGGNVFLLSCAAQELERFCSIDLLDWKLTDPLIKKWFAHYGIAADILVADSLNPNFKGYEYWDFVYIDGGHTGPIVQADILRWHERTRYIGFHDFADRGRKNKHRRVFQDVVDAIKDARDQYGWTIASPRGRSDIVFDTGRIFS